MSSAPIWILGKQYECTKITDTPNSLLPIQDQIQNFEGLEEDLQSRLLMTYRKDFPVILGSYYTSDMGWGCMHRTGQMILSQAFIMHYFGRDWKKPLLQEGDADQNSNSKALQQYYSILRWFEDNISARYSIHRIALSGDNLEKCVGEWYGPATVSKVLQKLVHRYQASEFAVYVSDGIVYKDQAKEMCTLNGIWKKGLIILIPARLSLTTLLDSQYDMIRSLFHFPQSLGIAGGKPKSSLYFIGYQNDLLFYLDPHCAIPSIIEMNLPTFDTQSYHPDEIRNMRMSDIDPSLAAGFYCKNEDDFLDFCQRVEECNQNLAVSLISVAETQPEEDSSTFDCGWPEEDEVETALSNSEDPVEDFFLM